MRETLWNLIGQVQDCGCDVTDVVEMNYVENDKLVDFLIANGVTVGGKTTTTADNLSYVEEIEELKADNERLRDMWAKAVSDASKYQTESMKYKKMLDNAYEMIGKITDRYG